jgi:hypothetical protein
VRGQEHRPAAIALLGDEPQELLLHQRIEPAGGLVEHQQLGIVERGLDKADLLAVAARELAERPVHVRLEALRELGPASEIAHAASLGQERQQLLAGQSRVIAEVAREVPQPRADRAAVPAAVEPEDLRRAARGMQEVEQRAHRRRLAGTVRPQETEHLAGFDPHRDVLDAAGAAVLLGQLLRLDDRHRTRPSAPIG